MKQYIIDARLEAVCLPLANEEYDLLESQIKRDGVLDPVKVWDRDGELVLLDGHNRLKICKANKLPIPESTTIEISSIDEAVIWICDNQKGRRNVATHEQQAYLSGKRYEAQKNINILRDDKGVFKSNAPARILYAPDGKEILPHNQNRTSHYQGLEEGISSRTVEKNAAFARGVDAVREVSPEMADKILKPDRNAPTLTRGTVAAIPKLKEIEPEKFVEAVKEIAKALDTKDKKVIELTVRDHVSLGEPTSAEKALARKHNLKPEHVRYAHDHNIPIENLKTVDQLAAQEARKVTTCSAIWDGFYVCKCGVKFEMFGSEHAPVCCPHCGKPDDLKRC
jgi:hypothetical protein